MYHARLHPEQYSHTFTTPQLSTLYDSLIYVTSTAVETLSDASKFPKEWLFQHRWGKGKKDAAMELPSGEAIKFLTVGGRTSCIVPSLQKKTGHVKAEVEGEEGVEGEDGEEEVQKESVKKSAKGKKKKVVKEEEKEEVEEKSTPKASKKRKASSEVVTKEEGDEENTGSPVGKKVKKAKGKNTSASSTATPEIESSGRRRSARLKKED